MTDLQELPEGGNGAAVVEKLPGSAGSCHSSLGQNPLPSAALPLESVSACSQGTCMERQNQNVQLLGFTDISRFETDKRRKNREAWLMHKAILFRLQ